MAEPEGQGQGHDLEDSDPEIDPGNLDFINQLPDELILLIFAKVGHSDRLLSRLVCKRWSSLLADRGFATRVVLTLKGGGRKSFERQHSLLQATSVPWTAVKFEKVKMTLPEYQILTFPPTLTARLRTLEFSKSIILLPQVVLIIQQIPTLESFAVLDCMIKNRLNESAFPPSATGTLKSLSLFMRHIHRLQEFLKLVNSAGMSGLKRISIRKIPGLLSTDGEMKSFYDELIPLLVRCAGTLTHLEMDIWNGLKDTLFINKVLTNILEVVRSLEVFDVHTEYEIASRLVGRPHSERVEALREQVSTFADFIRDQNNLRVLRVPNLPMGFPAALSGSLAVSVPSNLRKLSGLTEEYAEPGTLVRLNQLNDLEIDYSGMMRVTSQITPYRKVKTLVYKSAKEEQSAQVMSRIIQCFPNLTKLNCTGIKSFMGDIIDDDALQMIITNLKQLQSLCINPSSQLSDYGVTGLSRKFCSSFFKSRSIYMDDVESFVTEDRKVGVPLSDLKGLKELTIDGETRISDVGIFFGFRFSELRYLNVLECSEVTNWGLDCLGKFNPALDFLAFRCSSFVTELGIERLRSRMRWIKPKNFIVLYGTLEYGSSDESYVHDEDD